VSKREPARVGLAYANQREQPSKNKNNKRKQTPAQQQKKTKSLSFFINLLASAN
jgi:hypothetical protein